MTFGTGTRLSKFIKFVRFNGFIKLATLLACARLVTIPGRGGIESLNVSVAAAVLMWELCGRRAQPESTHRVA